MKFASTGTPAASAWNRLKGGDRRAGFTLLEALVALALVLAFVATLEPYLFHSRRLMSNAEQRVAAQVLLRTLLDAPFDRSGLANVDRAGEVNGLRWRVVSEPFAIDAGPSDLRPSWAAYRIIASVSTSGGQTVSAETIRLGKQTDVK
jgi:type II secretory pathway pseudopilin PulG